MNMSLLPHYHSRHDTRADTHSNASPLQHRDNHTHRLHWILLIVSLLLLLNMLATISGITAPLYSLLTPDEATDVAIQPPGATQLKQ